MNSEMLYAQGSPVAKGHAQPQVETELITRIVRGDTDAFYSLIAPYQRLMFISAKSVLGNDADAEDAVQEALLKALRALPKFRLECKFSTWLIQIVINESRMRLRSARYWQKDSLDEIPDNAEEEWVPKEIADWRPLPNATLEQSNLRQAIADAIAQLPDKYREVFVMRDVQDLSITETAQALGVSEGCVKTRLLRARLRMRSLLSAWHPHVS